jgi:hypothetical protein
MLSATQVMRLKLFERSSLATSISRDQPGFGSERTGATKRPPQSCATLIKGPGLVPNMSLFHSNDKLPRSRVRLTAKISPAIFDCLLLAFFKLEN